MIRPEFTVVKTVTLANGVRLEIAEKGPREGTPVVMLHGITDSLALVRTDLGSPAHRLARDRGLAARPRCSDQRPTDTRPRLRRRIACWPTCSTCGRWWWSATRWNHRCAPAADRPDLVRALVGIGTFARYGDKPDLRGFRDGELAALQAGARRHCARFQVSTLANPID